MSRLHVRRSGQVLPSRPGLITSGVVVDPVPEPTGPRLSGIHWGESRVDSDKAAGWRARKMDVIPLQVRRATWADLTTDLDPVLEPYFGTRGTTGLQMPAVKQVNLFVPFVPESESADYVAAFLAVRSGTHDAAYRQLGATLAAWQLPPTVLLFPGYSWNTGRLPFNGSGLIPADWKGTYQRIVEQIRVGYSGATSPAGITKSRLKFGISNTAGASPGIPAGSVPTDYFPGVSHCDYWGLVVFDTFEPVRDEASWTAKRTQTNGLDVNAEFALNTTGLRFNVPAWGVWNSNFDSAVVDGNPSYGNDNPFFITKMFAWFTEARVLDESYFEHPTTPQHWISTARGKDATRDAAVQNPNAGLKYRELLPLKTVVATGFKRTLDDVVYDLWGPPVRTDSKFPGYGKHEATLGGVNSGWDWFPGARDGIEPPYPHGIYNYHNVWGQVLPIAGGMPEIRVRCQVDLPETWHLLPDGRWVLVRSKAQAGGLEGAYWSTATFSPGAKWTSPAQFRSEEGGHSFDLAQSVNADGTPRANPIAHWFYKGYWPRIEIPAGAHVAIVTRMRLIPGAAGVDVNKARFLGCFSADAFDSFDTAVGADGKNPALYIPRHKIITSEWKPFGVVTGTESQIRSYPPMPFLVQ